MSQEHQKRAIGWYLYLHSEQPLPPAKLIETRHHRPPKTKATTPTEQHPGPELYSTRLSAEKAYGTAQAGQDAHDAPGIYVLSYNPEIGIKKQGRSMTGPAF